MYSFVDNIAVLLTICIQAYFNFCKLNRQQRHQ